MHLISTIEKYIPYHEQEKKDKEMLLYCIHEFDDVLTRKNLIVHITSSAFIINETRDKTLMVHHNIYNSWSWTGGHADGEKNLLAVAIREAKEETGVKNIEPMTTAIFSLDVLPVIGHVKKGEYVSAHLHLSVAYLVKGDENELIISKIDENSDVKWIPLDKVKEYTNEPHMWKVYKKIISKIEAIN